MLYLKPGPNTGRLTPDQPFRVLSWSIGFVGAVSAPVETFEQQAPTLWALAGSYREQPRWKMATQQVMTANHRANMEDNAAWGRLMKQAADTHAQIREDQAKAWQNRQDSQDYLHDQNMKTLHGVQDFETIGGDRISLPTSHSYVYQSGDGSGLVISKKPVLDPVAMGMQQLLPAVGRPTE